MPANGRWDLIRLLRVNQVLKLCVIRLNILLIMFLKTGRSPCLYMLTNIRRITTMNVTSIKTITAISLLGPVGISSMDDYSLPLFLTSHLLIAPLGVDCKFAVLKKKTYLLTPWCRVLPS